VVFCNGFEGDCKPVLENLYLSNGLILQDLSLYVAVTEEIHKYHFYKDNTTLSLLDTYPTPSTTCDNLAQDAEGTLYTACHPSKWLTIFHVLNPNNISPTQIMKKGKNGKKFDDMFLSTGEDWSAATVAVPDNQGFIYLGSVWEDGVLRCDMTGK